MRFSGLIFVMAVACSTTALAGNKARRCICHPAASAAVAVAVATPAPISPAAAAGGPEWIPVDGVAPAAAAAPAAAGVVPWLKVTGVGNPGGSQPPTVNAANDPTWKAIFALAETRQVKGITANVVNELTASGQSFPFAR